MNKYIINFTLKVFHLIKGWHLESPWLLYLYKTPPTWSEEGEELEDLLVASYVAGHGQVTRLGKTLHKLYKF